MAGRHPPRALARQELERAVQEALLHWHDDAWLAASDLAQSTVVAKLAYREGGAHAVRAALAQALERSRTMALPDHALALRAVERGYIARRGSHEQAAEELDVSRTTYYRLLRRGAQVLTRALQDV